MITRHTSFTVSDSIAEHEGSQWDSGSAYRGSSPCLPATALTQARPDYSLLAGGAAAGLRFGKLGRGLYAGRSAQIRQGAPDRGGD